jgi:DNA modification methylase
MNVKQRNRKSLGLNVPAENNKMKNTIRMETWAIDKLIPYTRNPRKNDAAVDRMCSSIREFGFKIPCLVRSDGEVVDGDLRLKAARKLNIAEIPVILCDEWTPAQVKAFRLLVNRSAAWADWDEELLKLELQEIQGLDFDLNLTGFDVPEIENLLAAQGGDEESVPALPAVPTSHVGDLWLLGAHRILCGDATRAEDVDRLLSGRKPLLLVTDPPYGVELDSEWRDRAGLNGCGPAQVSYKKHRTKGHTETSISGDTRADWSEAFELVPSLRVGYVWHASVFTREVLNGLLRIGFTLHQQIIWNKGRAVLTRTPYWFAHEPCWFVRQKNAPWYGKAGENTTVWEASSPKFMMGGSGEDKFDHPTQKPLELMRRPILNHTKRGEEVYDSFLGSGTTLMAADELGRVCYGLELDPKYVDVIVRRWEEATGKEAKLEGAGATFQEVKRQRSAELVSNPSSLPSARSEMRVGTKSTGRVADKVAVAATSLTGRSGSGEKGTTARLKKAA